MNENDVELRRIMGLSRQAYLQGDYMYALNILADDVAPYYNNNKDSLTEEKLKTVTEAMVAGVENNDYETLLSLAADLSEYYDEQGW
jgi:hypothetical protein